MEEVLVTNMNPSDSFRWGGEPLLRYSCMLATR